MILLISVALAEPYTLEADRFLIDMTEICGFTNLKYEEKSFVISAEYGCYHFSDDLFTLHRSKLNHNGQNIYFSDGVVHQDGRYWLNHVELKTPILLHAAHLSSNDGKVTLFDVTVSPCPCAVWDIRASQALFEEEWLWFEKPKLNIGNQQFSIPKKRISTKGAPVLLPRISWEEGPWIRQSFTTESGGEGWGEYRSILGPSASYSHLVRLDSMDVTPRLHLGYHENTETIRGSYTTNQKDDTGFFRSGVQAQIMTDDAYLTDYGTSYMARQQAFLDQRIWAQAQLFRAEIQQISTQQEPFSSPTAILEDSILLGPVMGYARIRTPMQPEPMPDATSMLNIGHDGKYVFGNASLTGHASLDERYAEPEIRLGGYAYSDAKNMRLMSRYAILYRSTGFFAETRQNLLRHGASLGFLTARVPVNQPISKTEVELLTTGNNPLFAGHSRNYSWLTFNNRYFQPSVYLWEGALALVGRTTLPLPNENVLFQPSAVYFPRIDLWQSIGLGLIIRQPKQCLQENIMVQWMPDRRLPVVNFQVSMAY